MSVHGELCLLRDTAIDVSQRIGFAPLGRSPLTGLCGTMAVLVRAIAGGEIVKGFVDGTHHYWNRLPDGEEIDLTSCQFGGDGWKPLKRGRIARKETAELADGIPLETAVFGTILLEELRRKES